MKELIKMSDWFKDGVEEESLLNKDRWIEWKEGERC